MDLTREPILIVGAGPVGLTLAWRLSQLGLDVQVFEAENRITDQLRASTFHPPTLDYFDESGITAELVEAGRITPTWQIRMQTSGERAEFDLSVLNEDTAHPYRLQCRQELLGRALVARLPKDAVHFGCPITAVAQDKDGVSITLNDEVVRGSILIGCDGAHSIVREAIGAVFEGETYPENTILVTTHFPFEDHLKELSGVNYIWKPGGTYSLLRLPDLWRISLHPAEGQTPEMALEDSAIRVQTREFIPQAGDIEIVYKRIYRVHRLVATHYRKNRIFIAGDAAHLNSPKGGMGMNGGIHDAWCLADLLMEVANGGDPDRLDKYEARRRPIACDDIVAQADKNRARMSVKNEAKRHEYLKSLQEIAANPIKSREFLLRSSMIEGLRRAEMIA